MSQILDLLGYYLLYDGDKKLTNIGIDNRYKMNTKNKKEIPVSNCEFNVQDVFYSLNTNEEEYSSSNNQIIGSDFIEPQNVDKRKSKFGHLRKIDLNFVEHIRISTVNGFNKYNSHTPLVKLADLDNNLCLCVKEKFYCEKSKDRVVKELLWHYNKLKENYNIRDNSILQKNRLLFYAKKSFMNTLTRLQKIKLFKDNNINQSIPYYTKWVHVDKYGFFKINNIKYQIDINKEQQYKEKFPVEYADRYLKNQFEMDKALVVRQSDKMWIFDEQINLVKNYTTVN